MVFAIGGRMINDSIISEAQDYLTIKRDEDYKRIVDIRHLIQKHGEKEVTDFLKDYLREKEKALRNMIVIDKTHRKVDYLAGAILRIMMAIKVLEGEEVNINAEAQQRTESGRVIQKRNSNSCRNSRKWQDKNSYGTNRIARYASQRHA